MTTNPAKQNHKIYTASELIASATFESNAAAAATVANWLDVTAWNETLQAVEGRSGQSSARPVQSVKEFDFEIACDATETLTSPQLFGVRQLPLVIADDDVDTVDFANNELDITSHGYLTGDGPFRLSTTDTLPDGLATDTDYWVIYVGAGTIQLATSLEGAIAGTAVAFTDGGTGTHTIEDKQSGDGYASPDDRTKRLHWFLYGDLNAGNTITVGAQQAYIERIQHSSLTLFYVLAATSGTGTQTLVVRCVPVQTVEW